MMNKIKNILLIVLCAAIFGTASGVSAQKNNTDKSAITQTELNKLVEFFEWAFESKFTAAERKKYNALVIKEYKQNPEESRKNADVLIAVLNKVTSLNEEKQAELREMFNEDYVADLRASGDEGSRLLLGIYERGQGGKSNSETVENSGDESVNDEPPPVPVGAGTSSKLVGAWFRSDGTGGATDGTGKTRYNSGTDTTFEFFADGKMKVTVKKETLSITQCRINETTSISGTYSVSGDQLIMNLAGGTSVGTDSCQSSGNYKKSLSASTLTKTFAVKNLESVFRPDAPLVLCLDGAADDQCFERLIK